MSLFKTTQSIAGKHFTQEMDLATDIAIYKKLNGELLMTVDSHGNCFDAEARPFGQFKLHYQSGFWYYESEDGSNVIETHRKMLFDTAEPIVVAQLFAAVL